MAQLEDITVGCQVNGIARNVSLEVNVEAPNGLSQPIVRTVSENCQTLKVKYFGFDK